MSDLCQWISIDSLDCGLKEEGRAISEPLYVLLLVIAMWGGGKLGGELGVISRDSGGVR